MDIRSPGIPGSKSSGRYNMQQEQLTKQIKTDIQVKYLDM